MVTIDPHISLPTNTTNTTTPVELRSHEYAVLYACQQLGTNVDDMRKTLYITDSLHLQPFSLVNEDGVEHSALAHSSVIEKALSSPSVTIRGILPVKRSYTQMVSTPCFSCLIPTPRDLQPLFSMSPYDKLLMQRGFVELTDDLSELANLDWHFHPQAKFYVVQLFASAILFRTDNNQAVMINCIEGYGRGKSVDIYREPFGVTYAAESASLYPVNPHCG
ncbi:hypothetical protein DFQ29_003423 [Apophysomyces sp. BC1021]|nr:hypothetical protein DFQ29_003423 [Apophysomyces sp. BC1021]